MKSLSNATMNKDRLLNKFLHAELTPVEEERFYQFIKTDKEFAEEVKIHSLLYVGRNLKLKKHLSDVDTTAYENSSQSQSLHYIRMLKNIAAIFVMAIVLLGIYQMLPEEQDAISIETILQDTYPAPGLLASAEQDIDPWQQAIVYYTSKNYEDAKKQISQIAQPTVEHKLYLSLSEMYSIPPNYKIAIDILEEIAQDPDNMHLDATSWHLALAYINANQKESAKPLLISISESEHYKKSQAIEILHQFDSL